MIPSILLGFVAAAVVLVIIITTRPATFRVTRSTVIDAAPATVFAEVNDFHKWEAWSPWAKLDPDSKATFEGPAAGVGAGFAWAGNNQVGEGSQRIIESQSPERILIKIDFTKPFTASNDVEFTFVPDAAGTRVTWTMSGKNNFMGKAVSLFMDCDKMVGPQFEEGLASLKASAESKSTQ